MRSTLIFAAGFAAGWLGRGALDPSKSATVQIVAFALDSVARIKRLLAIERERFEDMVAEAHDTVARRRAARSGGAHAHEAAEHAA
jgi:hypothetical protein